MPHIRIGLFFQNQKARSRVRLRAFSCIWARMQNFKFFSGLFRNAYIERQMFWRNTHLDFVHELIICPTELRIRTSSAA